MIKFNMKIFKLVLSSIFCIVFLTACSNIAKNFVNNSAINHKNYTGSNNFDSLINHLMEQQDHRLSKYIHNDEVVLVSDFVNIDNLTNRSKLGFLLSEHLKNSLTNRLITVREVELSENFEYGSRGFNVLTRKQQDINKKDINNTYAFVGTYSITTESLIVFIKLIDIRNGNILSSASSAVLIDQEIIDLDRTIKTIPHMVL